MAQSRLNRLLTEAKETPGEKKIAAGFKGIASTLKSQTDMWQRAYKGNRNTKAGAYLCLGQILSACWRMADEQLDDSKVAGPIQKAMRAASQAGTNELMSASQQPEKPEKPAKKRKR